MIIANKLHTAQGTADTLPAAAKMIYDLQNIFMDCFKGYGFDHVSTPTFEYINVFSSGNGEERSMIKFFDNYGNILALRPDFTPSIARMAATKYNDEDIIKLCYSGKAFINNEAYGNVKQKEFVQSGVEYLGDGSYEADTEIIALTIDCLKKSGLKEFQIEIGHAGFFKGLVNQAKLGEEKAEQLRQLMNRKDFVSIERFLADNGVAGKVAELITNLPHMFGDISVIENVDTSKLNDESKKALQNLRDIYSMLCDYGMSECISFDLGLVQSLDYYTGMIFKGFTHNVGFPVCGGGRYDSLLAGFGKSMPATGVAVWVDRIFEAITRGGIIPEAPAPEIILSYNEKYRKKAVATAEKLRAEGKSVQMYYKENAEEYALKRGVEKLYQIDENIKIIEIN